VSQIFVLGEDKPIRGFQAKRITTSLYYKGEVSLNICLYTDLLNCSRYVFEL